MSASRRAAYARLLRWYPAAWRRADGDVMLDTLEEHADAEGRDRPDRAEAWSIRAHGLVERTTPRVVLVLAALALVLALVRPVSLLTGAGALLGSPLPLALPWAGALLASLALVGLVARAGALRAEHALLGAALAVPAWILGGLAAASWAMGFADADAGVPVGLLGRAAVVLAPGAWILGTAALAVVLDGLLAIPSRPARRIVAVGVALPGALLLGLLALSYGAVALAMAALLVAARRRMREADGGAVAVPVAPGAFATAESSGGAPVRGPGRVPVHPAPLTARARRAVVVAALAGSVLGLACAAFALAGSAWLPAVGDATDAMRAGILAGSLVALLPLAAGAAAVRPRLGRVAVPAALAMGAALVTVAASYAVPGIDAAAGELLPLAAALVGLAGALLLLPVLPGGPALRGLLLVGAALGIAAVAGMTVALVAAFVAPVLGIVVAVRVGRRSTRARPRQQPA